MKIKITTLYWAISLCIIFPALLLVLGVRPLLVFDVILWSIILIVCINRFNNNIFLICFLFSFAIFLMSGDIAEDIFDIHYYLRYDLESTTHAHICIAISLFFILTGFMLSSKQLGPSMHIFGKVDTLDPLRRETYYRYIRKASKLAYYGLYVIMIVDTIYAVSYVGVHGYVSYYISFRSIFPSFISGLASYAPAALCIFLATMPPKKECKIILISYFIYAVLGFAIGQRGAFVYNVAFIIGYFWLRNRIYNDGEIWLKRRHIIMMIISVPFAIVALFLYGYIRMGNDIQFNSISSTIVSFFVNIGSSSSLIKSGYNYADQLSSFKFYSLGGLLNYFKYSKIFHLFSSITVPGNHTAQFALEGHSFDSMISYLTMETRYLNGEGAGSCFIAELYADFGYIGIAIGSAIYGFFFKKLSNIKKENWLSSGTKMYMLLNILKAPRGPYDNFISGVINVYFLFLILFVYFVAKSMFNKQSNKLKVMDDFDGLFSRKIT